MKVGFIGLGKLGLPCALAIEKFGGHEVYGTDASPDVLANVARREVPYREEGLPELLADTKLTVCGIEDLVRECEILFVAVQTPHDPKFEGISPLPEERADFDYRYLVQAVQDVSGETDRQGRELILVVISTVLPGTIDREVRPVLSPHIRLCYNPFFIAMGTTIRDFMNPEFVLLGVDDPGAAETVTRFYGTLHGAEVVRMSIQSAELTKVAYNTFIGMKIVFANTLMEVCHGTGAHVDDVTGALCKATNRLISPKYLQAGMGDGGGCHPRDNIAMSYLARKLGLSYDLFESLMRARERQTEWLASMAISESVRAALPIVILGKAFKPETNLTVGSPAVLLEGLLRLRGVEPEMYDPYIDAPEARPSGRAVYVLATKHAVFADWAFPDGSVVIDPWGLVEGPAVLSVGRGSVPTQEPIHA